MLSAYGSYVPYHPGRWRVVRVFESLACDTWKTQRRFERGGLVYGSRLDDLVPRAICYCGGYEWGETRIAKRLLKPGDVAFDLGAHIGYFALHFSRFVGAQGRVYAFEPSPDTFTRLQNHLVLNHADNVIAVPGAISDRIGSIGIQSPGTSNTGNFSVSGEGDIPTITLDEFVRAHDIQRVNLIKVDIEGCEMKFLKGAETTLRRFHPPLLLELNPAALSMFGSSAEEVRSFLKENNYELNIPRWFGLQPLTSTPKSGEYCNVLAQ